MAAPTVPNPAAIAPTPPELRVPAAVRELCKPSYVSQRSPFEWEVIAGLPLLVFVEATGPSVITRCNLLVHKPLAVQKSAAAWVDVRQHSASRNTSATVKQTHSLGDVFTLSAAGGVEAARRKRRNLADVLVVRGTLYCSGTSDVRSDQIRSDVGSRRLLVVQKSSGPNCQRKCGGMGHCVQGCNGTGLGHQCQFHVTLSASLSQVSAGKITVKIAGTHVPPGTPWVCVHPLALSASRLMKDLLVQTATKYGQTATAVLNKTAGK